MIILIEIDIYIRNVFSFPCIVREESRMIREQLFILILHLLEEKQQYAVMWVGGIMDFGRISRQESIMMIALSESPLKPVHGLL